jgi:flotillin
VRELLRKVNEAIRQGGEAYFRYKQIEMLPEVAPFIADALAKARLVTISGGGESAAEGTTNSITGVIQTVLAAQLVSRAGLGGGEDGAEPAKAVPVGRIVGDE